MRKMSYKRVSGFGNQAGFTLAEIIIVFALIALISTYMLGSSFINARNHARDAQRKTDLKVLTSALEIYYNDHGRYPAGNAAGQIMGCAGATACAWGGAFDDGATVYAAELPADPRASSGRRYVYRGTVTGWQIYAAFEGEDNPDLDRNGDGSYTSAGDGYTFVNCGVGYCNYGISSGNVRPSTNPLP